jgi:transmembrane sensor
MKTKAEHPEAGSGIPPQIKDAAARWVARRDAGLTAAEELAYQTWLHADPRHESAIKRCGSAWSALDRPVDRGTVDYVLKDLAALERRRRRRRLASAAVTCIAFFALVSVWRFGSLRPDSHLTSSSNAVVLLPVRQALPDGTVVELRDGAEIIPEFTSGLRMVRLRRGEAHFQVTRDVQRPFVVETNGVQVRAVGTAFSVQSNRAQVEVLVTEGRVAVISENVTASSSSAAPTAPAPTYVDAGHSLFIDVTQSAPLQATAVSVPVMSQRLSWRAPRLEFTGTSLSEAIKLLNKHANSASSVHFVIEDASIAKVQISGLFRADNTDAFVGLLEGGFGIAAERRGDNEIVLRKAH